MHSSSPLDAKEQVRQAVDIVDVVGEAFELRRQGRNFVCRCPWHDDSRPSLTVNQERQTWRCWVCDIGGDIFSFVMKRDGVDFREALEMLADRAGISLQQASGPKPQPGGPGDKKTLYGAMAWAEGLFHRCLLESPEAEPARAYLAGRQINGHSLERFRIGYAPDQWDWLKNQAGQAGYSMEVLERVGLVRQRQSGGGWYDFFRGRVMFPIHDLQARSIAFGGRILPHLAENAGGKYVNSPETPLYNKSQQLYALHLAREAVSSHGTLAVMEGYTDVVMAHQHGVKNVVAVCGTALGAQHLKLIQRFTDRVALVLDGDQAGQRRASEVLELFVQNQVDLRILTLPENLDPCDFIATPEEGPKEGFGAEAFRRLLDAAPDALSHKLETVTNGLAATENTHDAARAAEEVLATLAKAATGALADSAAMLREQSILSRLAGRLRLEQGQLRKRLADIRSNLSRQSLAESYVPEEEQPAQEPWPKLSIRDQELLELMLIDGDCARRIAESVSHEQLETRPGQTLFLAFRDALEVQGEIELGWLMDRAQSERQKSLLVALDNDATAKQAGDRQQRLADLLKSFKKASEDAHRRQQLAALGGESLNDHQEAETLGEIFATLKNRQTGSLPTEG